MARPRSFPPPPKWEEEPILPGLVATLPEKLVYQWLTKRGILFQFQTSLLGGRLERGGAVTDFLLYDRVPQLVIRVQGSYWHKDIDRKADDQLQKERLINEGYAVVDAWEEDIYQRLNGTMSLALIGEEMPH